MDPFCRAGGARGAAPIHRAILSGDEVTGITIMQMDVGLDTGPMIFTKELPITSDMTTSELHDEMAEGQVLFSRLCQATLMAGTLKPVPQPEEGVTYAHKMEKAEGLLNWNEPAEVLMRKVRALNPWPGVWFECEGKRIKVIKAATEPGTLGSIGQVVDENLSIQTGDGFAPLKCKGKVQAPWRQMPFKGGILSPREHNCNHAPL